MYLSGRYLVGFLACAGFFVAGMAVDRCFANPVVAEAQSSSFISISGSQGSIYVLRSNGDVEQVNLYDRGNRIVYPRSSAKIETSKEFEARFQKDMQQPKTDKR